MKRTILVLALTALLALGGSAFAEICTNDAVPAASMLIPYFAVDFSEDGCAGSGVTTLFSVNNASAAPTIAHVTLWTDWSVPVIDFDIYLSGYDVQTLNLRQIFCDGSLPETGFGAAVGVAAPGTNEGLFSLPNVPFPSCNNSTTPGDGPYYANPAITNIPGLLEVLQNWFTGQEALSSIAGSGQLGDTTAVGYITIDNLTDCSLEFPATPGYFTSGIVSNVNQLWGDFFIVDPANDFAQGFNAAHLEAGPASVFADPLNPNVTFYGRYNGATGVDLREPLGTTYATRYALGGAFNGTNYFIWREGNADANSVPVGSAPSWFPLDTANQSGAGPIIIFDEDENPIVPEVFTGPSNPIPPDNPEITIPYEVNLVNVRTGAAAAGVFDEIATGDFEFGWIYMNLQSSRTVYGTGFGQAWVGQRFVNDGRFSAGWEAISLDTSCIVSYTVNPAGPIAVNPDEPILVQ
ncbi:MAG: hypothetical protein AAF772_11540 [Acidobacteriota bacterium]